MQELRSLAEVAAACEGDPQCLWAAQGLRAGGRAWAGGGAIVVGCPALSARDRLIVRGPADEAAPLVRTALAALGPTFVPVGDPPLMAACSRGSAGLSTGTYSAGWTASA